MPDIEKRLESFVRVGHGFVVFPGGVGTAEEILYLLGVLLDPRNADIPFPLVFTGPPGAATYFEQIDRFIHLALGDAARNRYRIVVDNPVEVAQIMASGMEEVRKYPSAPSTPSISTGCCDRVLPDPVSLARQHAPPWICSADLPGVTRWPANLRRMFSGIVAGNVKPEGVRAIREARTVRNPLRGRRRAVAGRAADRLSSARTG
jgi:hypothetical protein